jgi:hypothetical protein
MRNIFKIPVFKNLFWKRVSQNKEFSSPQPSLKTEELIAIDWYNKWNSIWSSGNYKDASEAFSEAIE